MSFMSSPDGNSVQEQRAKQALDDLHRVSPHARAHGQPDMARARRQYERDNPSRMRYFWRVWDFLFGRGRTRMGH